MGKYRQSRRMENYNFHHLDLEDLQSEAQTPKLDVYKNYLFVVLQFPTWQTHSRSISTQEIDMFLGDEYLITIQHTKSKEMKNFFFRCMRNRKIKSDWKNDANDFCVSIGDCGNKENYIGKDGYYTKLDKLISRSNATATKE